MRIEKEIVVSYRFSEEELKDFLEGFLHHMANEQLIHDVDRGSRLSNYLYTNLDQIIQEVVRK